MLAADAVALLLITERLETGCDQLHPLLYLVHSRSVRRKARKLEKEHIPCFACPKESI
jgi:hypothetical protein